MGCLTVIIFILNIGFSIYVDAMCFVFTQAMGMNTGLGTIIAIVGIIIDNVAFILGYSLSVKVTFAPRDFWHLSSYGVLMKKIACGWAAKALPWALWFFPGLAL